MGAIFDIMQLVVDEAGSFGKGSLLGNDPLSCTRAVVGRAKARLAAAANPPTMSADNDQEETSRKRREAKPVRSP